MRELTRSMIRFSWAMPLLGMNQVAKMATPENWRRPFDPAIETLDALSATAQAHLGPELQRTYAAGLRVQDNLVDTVLGIWPSSQPRAGRASHRDSEGCC